MLGCRYVRPQFASADKEPQLVLRAARHPVLDAVLEGPGCAKRCGVAWG